MSAPSASQEVQEGERVVGWVNDVAALPDVSPPVEDLPSSPVVPEEPAPVVAVDDRPDRVGAYIAKYNHANNYPRGYHGRPMSDDIHAHPLWKCPLVEMNVRRRYEEFFLHLDHQVGRIDQSWSRFDLLKLLHNTVEEGLFILPDVDVDMRENLRGGNFGDERCYQLGHSPYPFRGFGREELPGIAAFPCRRCWSCARLPNPLPEPAVSETGIGEDEEDDPPVEPFPIFDAVIASPDIARAVTPSASPHPEVQGLGVDSPLASPATLALQLDVEVANVEQARAALADDEREDALLAEEPLPNPGTVGVLSQSSSASGNSASSNDSIGSKRGVKRGFAEMTASDGQENVSGSGSGSTSAFVSRFTGYYPRVGYL
ncbi:hypothetical protein CF319_g199 [Tilletia indica]|nr:hypothetical protein CF319_g199 [Tilletia indica]